MSETSTVYRLSDCMDVLSCFFLSHERSRTPRGERTVWRSHHHPGIFLLFLGFGRPPYPPRPRHSSMRGVALGALRRSVTVSLERHSGSLLRDSPAAGSFVSPPSVADHASASSGPCKAAAGAAHLPSRRCPTRPSSSSTRCLFSARGSVAMSATAWDGSGTQEDLMYRDECILVVSEIPRPTPDNLRRR